MPHQAPAPGPGAPAIKVGSQQALAAISRQRCGQAAVYFCSCNLVKLVLVGSGKAQTRILEADTCYNMYACTRPSMTGHILVMLQRAGYLIACFMKTVMSQRPVQRAAS